MGILSGFKKMENYLLDEDGNFKLLSRWTSSQSVEMDDGTTLEETVEDIRDKLGTVSISGTIRTDLSSDYSAPFEDGGDITPGVTGILSISHGGTGASSASQALRNLGITVTASNLNQVTSKIPKSAFTFDAETSTLTITMDTATE